MYLVIFLPYNISRFFKLFLQTLQYHDVIQAFAETDERFSTRIIFKAC